MFSSQRMAQNTASILSERRRLGSWGFFSFLTVDQKNLS